MFSIVLGIPVLLLALGYSNTKDPGGTIRNMCTCTVVSGCGICERRNDND